MPHIGYSVPGRTGLATCTAIRGCVVGHAESKLGIERGSGAPSNVYPPAAVCCFVDSSMDVRSLTGRFNSGGRAADALVDGSDRGLWAEFHPKHCGGLGRRETAGIEGSQLVA